MEGIHLVKDLLQQGDWMVKLDLKDAYVALPIHQDDRQSLQVHVKGQHISSTVSPSVYPQPQGCSQQSCTL